MNREPAAGATFINKWGVSGRLVLTHGSREALNCIPVGGAVMKRAAFFRLAVLAGATAVIAGCSASPTSVVSDDAALCRYATEVGGAESVAACRHRLDKQQRIHTATNASRIEGYALLNTAAPPTAVADQCRQANPPKECETGDVTGTIKRDPAK